MFNVISVTLGIISYCISPIVGFIVLTLILLKNFIIDKDNIFNRFIYALILLLPFYTQKFISDGNSEFFNYFFLTLIVFLVFVIIKINGKVNSVPVFISVLFLLIICFIRSLFVDDIDTMQIFCSFALMIIIPYFVYCYLKQNKDKLKEINVDKYVNTYIQTVIATSIALIISYMAYNISGIELGNIEVFSGGGGTERVNFNLLFVSYSALSAYLATGLILIVVKLFKKVKLSMMFAIIIVTIATALTSSKTGIVTAAIVVVIMLVTSFNVRKINLKKLIMMLLVVVVVVSGIIILTGTRYDDIINDNGRFQRIENNIELFKENPIWGLGFHDNPEILLLAHNFLVEYLVQTGIICFAIMLYILFKLLKFTYKSQYKYAMWCALIANLFFTCLHGQKCFVILCIIIIADALKSSNKEENINEN